MKALTTVFFVGTISMSAVSSLFADQTLVWNEEYEQYISADFQSLVICPTPLSSKQGVVWSEEYEEFISADFPTLRLAETQVIGKPGEIMWSEDYEEFLPGEFVQYVITPKSSC